MKTSKQWLDTVQIMHKVRTHSDLAKMLRTSQPHVSRIMKEYNYLSDDLAEQVSVLCGVPLAVVLSDIQIERASTDNQRNAWTMISAAMNAMLNTTAKATPVAILALVMGMSIAPSETRANIAPPAKNSVSSLYYVNPRRKGQPSLC